jgi:hypothetical protein
LEFAKILIFITVDIFKHTAKKIRKLMGAGQKLPEVYGTTLSEENCESRKNDKNAIKIVF